MVEGACILVDTVEPCAIDEVASVPRVRAPAKSRRRVVPDSDSDAREDNVAHAAQLHIAGPGQTATEVKGTLASHVVNSARLQSLVSMGFLPGPARNALQVAGGNVDTAIDICLRSSTPQAVSASTSDNSKSYLSASRGPVTRPGTSSHAAATNRRKAVDTNRRKTKRPRQRARDDDDDWIVEKASSASPSESESMVLETDADSSEAPEDEDSSEAPKKKVRKNTASRKAAPRPVMLRQPDSDSDDGSDVSIASGKKRKRGSATRALREVSAIAQNLLLDALSGPTLEGESLGAMRKRRVDVRRSISRGHTNLRADYWPTSEDLQAKCESFSLLRSHQKVGVRWLLALHTKVPGMILADEMGLGKTAQTLCFLDILRSPRPSLIVAPASLIATWEMEAAKWTPRLCTLKYHASSELGRMEAQDTFFRDPTAYQLVITTPQAFHNKGNRSHFFRKVSFEYLVVDEAHGLKNSGTNRYQEISKHAKCNGRLLLTGTPIQNSLTELATLLGFALSDGKKSNVTEELRAIAEEPMDKALQQMQTAAAPLILRRLKSDVLSELPAKHGEIVYVEMTDRQRKMYQEEMTAHQGTRLTAGTVKDAFHRLRRVCLHPLLARKRLSKAQMIKLVDELKTKRPDFAKASEQRCLQEVSQWNDFDKHVAAVEHNLSEEFKASEDELLDNGKVKELFNILNKQSAKNGKTLVFSQFTQMLDIIETVLRMSRIAYTRLDGKTAIDERASIVSGFQKDGGPSVFLISTKAGGVGLNLTAANIVVMLDLDFNPQNSRQAEDRVHRLGQSKEVTVYYLICKGTVEEMVLTKNISKMRLDQHFGAKRGTLEVAIDATDVAKNVDVEGEENCEDEQTENSKYAKECEKDVMSELRAQLAGCT